MEGGEPVVSLMSTLISTVTTIATSFVDVVDDWLGVFTASGNELLLFFVLSGFISLGIGLLIKLRRIF